MFLHFYSLTRKAALALPHWEFKSLADGINRIKADRRLELYEMGALAFGGASSSESKNYVAHLRSQSEGKPHQPTPRKTDLELMELQIQEGILQRSSPFSMFIEAIGG